MPDRPGLSQVSDSVFITGASSGIGRALATFYARRGAALGLVARRAAVLDELQIELLALGARAVRCYVLDVADERALHDAAQNYLDCVGVPRIVVASAGVSSGTLTGRSGDVAAIRRIFEINVFGMVHTFAPFVEPMRQAAADGRPVRLVGIASVAGIRGLPGAEAYSASKAAVIAYLESLRVELRASKIRVVTIVPGYIATPMTAINPYAMPFLLPDDPAAKRFALAIARGRSYSVIPLQMGLVAKVLRLLPNWLYDRLFANAPQKPRVL